MQGLGSWVSHGKLWGKKKKHQPKSHQNHYSLLLKCRITSLRTCQIIEIMLLFKIRRKILLTPREKLVLAAQKITVLRQRWRIGQHTLDSYSILVPYLWSPKLLSESVIWEVITDFQRAKQIIFRTFALNHAALKRKVMPMHFQFQVYNKNWTWIFMF